MHVVYILTESIDPDYGRTSIAMHGRHSHRVRRRAIQPARAHASIQSFPQIILSNLGSRRREAQRNLTAQFPSRAIANIRCVPQTFPATGFAPRSVTPERIQSSRGPRRARPQRDAGRPPSRVESTGMTTPNFSARAGHPFIDAAMAQSKETGWIHHLARRAVAFF